jgi:hypothetical protein
MDFVFIGFISLGLLCIFWRIADSKSGKAQKHTFRPNNLNQ